MGTSSMCSANLFLSIHSRPRRKLAMNAGRMYGLKRKLALTALESASSISLMGVSPSILELEQRWRVVWVYVVVGARGPFSLACVWVVFRPQNVVVVTHTHTNTAHQNRERRRSVTVQKESYYVLRYTEREPVWFIATQPTIYRARRKKCRPTGSDGHLGCRAPAPHRALAFHRAAPTTLPSTDSNLPVRI